MKLLSLLVASTALIFLAGAGTRSGAYNIPMKQGKPGFMLSELYRTGGGVLLVQWNPQYRPQDTTQVVCELQALDLSNWQRFRSPLILAPHGYAVRFRTTGADQLGLDYVPISADSATIVTLSQRKVRTQSGLFQLRLLADIHKEPIQNLPKGTISGHITIGAGQVPATHARLKLADDSVFAAVSESGRYELPCNRISDSLRLVVWFGDRDSISFIIRKRHPRTQIVVDVWSDAKLDHGNKAAVTTLLLTGTQAISRLDPWYDEPLNFEVHHVYPGELVTMNVRDKGDTFCYDFRLVDYMGDGRALVQYGQAFRSPLVIKQFAERSDLYPVDNFVIVDNIPTELFPLERAGGRRIALWHLRRP